MAAEVVKALLKEIIPRFGFPGSLESDNGPAFVSQVREGITSALSIKWTLHSAWRPQSSGKLERSNQNLKWALTKLCQETQENWIMLLLIALLCMRLAPRVSALKVKLKVSAFGFMYDRPIPQA